MDKENRGRVIAGAVLVLLGIAFFVMNFLGGLGQAAIIFAVGAVFLVAYFGTRQYGFLIPGCIIMGIGLGQFGAAGFSFSGFGSLALGVGFIAIFVMDWLYGGKMRWWPLIPGGILVLGALAEASATLQILLSRGWPLILVVIGLVILAGAFGLTGRRNQ
ncbi:MAG: hypothetical protein HY741_26130 [Chloroflexi bacterium]|nr:hypothetical protein [Chloroflexota bacterium]